MLFGNGFQQFYFLIHVIRIAASVEFGLRFYFQFRGIDVALHHAVGFQGEFIFHISITNDSTCRQACVQEMFPFILPSGPITILRCTGYCLL